MKFQSFVSLLLAFLVSLLVAGCGGGGAQPDPNRGGDLTIAPDDADFYAGVASVITVSGGRTPYSLASSDPAILPVPRILNGHFFEVVPANPGVIDAGLQDTDVPRRTVIITARDTQGFTFEATIRVIRNFLTAYNIQLFSTTCPEETPACAGGETVVRFAAITNGSLHGGKLFRLEMVRGPCLFVDPQQSENLRTTYTTTSDHQGTVTAVMRCPPNTPSQLAVIRIVDVQSGASQEHSFVVSQASASQSPPLIAIPDEFTFTGADSQTCGTGTADFLVFDGQPPYFATSSFANFFNAVQVTPRSDTNPGRFTITASNPGVCVTDATIIVTDSRGGRTTVTVNTEEGQDDPPAPADFAVAPTSLTLACGTSGSVTAVGGSGFYQTSSSHPRVTAVVSGNTITITRLSPDAPTDPAFPTTASVAVSDGSTVETVTVTVPAVCP